MATEFLKSGHIDLITLDNLCPLVFVGEHIPSSEVWHARLELRRGERYLIEAASGGGKSSLCSFIYGARRDYQGKLLFNGCDTRTLHVEQWQSVRRNNIAYLTQDLMLFPELSAIENINLKNDATGFVSAPQIEEWMDYMGISMRRDFPAGKMSVGQQQRVAIIRALCQPFDFILLDEPVSHLDEANNRKAAEMIAATAAQRGAAIVSTSVGNPLLLDNATTIKL